MAWQLVAEVLNHAPRDLTNGERLVLVAIAEQVHQDRLASRQCSCSAETLRRLTGMHWDSIRDALRRLERQRQMRVRIDRGLGGDGRLLYAHNGSSAKYRVPELPPPPGCPCQLCKGGSPAHPSALKGGSDTPPSQNGKGGSLTVEGWVSDHGKGGSPTHPYREPGDTGGTRARADGPRSLCGHHNADPDRDCHRCRRIREEAETERTRKPPPPPPCGQCEARPSDPSFTRVMPDGSKCPRCHPAYLNGAVAHAS